MYNPYGDEPRLNKFILISVVLHAILFLTFPDFHSLLTPSDVPGMTGGGVIQVMHVETSVSQRYSPITDRLSQTAAPRVTEPRPVEEETPQAEATAPVPAEIPAVEEPQVERSRPLTPTQPDPPEVQESPVEEQPPLFGEGELMTSETGPELAIDEEDKEIEAAEDSGTPASQADTTGSGEGTQGEADAPGLAQSGEGEAESAPPAPAPLPGGFSLYPGGGNPIYPKDAAHEGKEGTVITTVRVTASGQLQEVITTQSSGHEDLDAQAKYEAEMAPWPEHDFDYEVEVKHTYTREEFVPSVSYGLMKPQDAP